MYKKIFITTIICAFVSCTSFNSDKANTELIQGRWQLVDAEYTSQVLDTVEVDYARELTFLVFEGDKCTQLMPDLKDTIHFTFVINDYYLKLYKDSTLINNLSIDSLTQDKLILSQKKSEHVYKKIRH